MLTFPDAASCTRRMSGKAADSWPLKKIVLVASTQLAVVVLCCSLIKVTATTNTAVVQNGANPVPAESTAQNVSVPQITHIIWTNVSPDLADNGFALGGETGPRKDRVTSKSNNAAGISTFAVSVNGRSLDESLRCGRELLNKIQKGVDGEAKIAGGAESLKDSNCGNTVKFVVSFEPIERKHSNFLLTPGGDNPSLFDDKYEAGGEEFTGSTDEVANRLFRIITGHPDPKPGLDDKESEVGMTE
jgi:hypothetical protein